MIATDLLLNRRLAPAEVARGIAVALAVPAAAVRVVDDVTELLEQEWQEGTRVIVERTLRDGDYPLQLSITPRGATATEAPLPAVQRLCQEWHCECLLPDETLAPSGWLRVTADTAQPAHLDPDALDREEYVLAAA